MTKHYLKRTVGLVLALLLVLSNVVPNYAFATNDNKELVNEVVGETNLNLNEVAEETAGTLAAEETIDFYFEPTALQVAYKNAMFINGKFFDYINNAAPHTIQIPKTLLNDGQNIFTFICGSSATGTYYDETVAQKQETTTTLR